MNFIVKDYKQNDTGLEYIGTANQQIGDGGSKDSQYTIPWDASAKLISTADLKADNTILCKLTVTAP